MTSGQIVVESVPAPIVEPATALVEVSHSCISAGTELAGIQGANESLYKKVLRRPDLARKAVKMVADKGLRRTINVAKGEAPAGKAIGYSAAGRVIEAGSNLANIKPGMRVACAGAGIANHAEYISVPRNLLVPIPDQVDYTEASTVTLGAIALQGLRRADPTMGESFVVIGLGIIGQLTAQLLKANGCRVIGIDLDESRLNLAKELGTDYPVSLHEKEPITRVRQITDGYGADGVIITAASASHEIVSSAFQMCRKKGRVVLVGDVGLNLKRSDIYKKEIDFLVSTSYGPGRYDDRYELEGLEYPVGYVRWTETRNMAEYLRLISEEKLCIKPLISEVYPVDEAVRAYESLKASSERPLIILLNYDHHGEPTRILELTKTSKKAGKIGIAIVGAGSFIKGTHIPNLGKLKDQFDIRGIVSRTGANAVVVAEQAKADIATTDFKEVLSRPDIDAVLIGTRHHMHASLAVEAIRAGKHVLVEKPLALNADELSQVIQAYESLDEGLRPVLTVGYNRRFSPYLQAIKRELTERVGPMIAVYRMNAGYLPKDHWVYGAEGGGRNIGEGCHIYDVFNFFTDSEVESIQTASIVSNGETYGAHDNFSATIRYKDGSLCTLIYTTLGNKDYPKEHLELYVDGKVMVLNNYQRLDYFGVKRKPIITSSVEKGQFEELQAFAQAINDGQMPISFGQLVQASEISFVIEEQLAK